MRVVLCVLAVCVAEGLAAAALPSFIHPCSASDPNLSRCISKAIEQAGPKFADGLPELGIAPLDPVQLGTVKVDNNALDLVFTDTVVTGLKHFRLNNFKLDIENGKAHLDFTANVTLRAQYEMDGQILILPIRGEGQSKIKITNLNIIINYDFETKNDHWVVSRYTKKYSMDRAQFKFSNLFGGNKQLGNTVHTVVNANWEPVIREIAPVAFEQIIKACVEEVKKLFAAVPASKLLPV